MPSTRRLRLILVQSRRDKKAAKRLFRKLLRKQGRTPRVLVTDKLKSYAAAKREIMPGVEHRQHKGRCCTDRLRLPARARSAQAQSPQTTGNPTVPFKHHAKHRHHIAKPRYRVTNGPEYGAALRRRGSLTVWLTDEAIAAWRAEPRTTPGGQPHYSTLAIRTALTMRAVFRLALRQTEGLIGSVIALLGLYLTVPDHSR